MRILKKVENYVLENQFKKSRKGKFDNILDFAKQVLIQTETHSKYKLHPLIDVVRLIGRKLQSDYMFEVIKLKEYKSEFRVPFMEKIFFACENRCDDYIFEDVKEIHTTKSIDLSKDLVIPYPWKRERLVRAISFIGDGRVSGNWRQDNNHQIIVFLPMGLALVHGGNHSISSGIIQGEGIIHADRFYDISCIYDHVYCDGNNYIRKRDNSIISEVKSVEFAALFEIGRLIRDNNISYY